MIEYYGAGYVSYGGGGYTCPTSEVLESWRDGTCHERVSAGSVRIGQTVEYEGTPLLALDRDALRLYCVTPWGTRMNVLLSDFVIESSADEFVRTESLGDVRGY
jgi:hypothetical protein